MEAKTFECCNCGHVFKDTMALQCPKCKVLNGFQCFIKEIEVDYTQGIGKHVLKNRMKSLDNCDEFQKIFKTRLKPFWDSNIFGFDIIKFDQWLETPDDISMNDHILARFGQAGVDMIDKLLA